MHTTPSFLPPASLRPLQRCGPSTWITFLIPIFPWSLRTIFRILMLIPLLEGSLDHQLTSKEIISVGHTNIIFSPMTMLSFRCVCCHSVIEFQHRHGMYRSNTFSTKSIDIFSSVTRRFLLQYLLSMPVLGKAQQTIIRFA
jgi:hypothetical protein